jgi:hypothetical protein
LKTEGIITIVKALERLGYVVHGIGGLKIENYESHNAVSIYSKRFLRKSRAIAILHFSDYFTERNEGNWVIEAYNREDVIPILALALKINILSNKTLTVMGNMHNKICTYHQTK